MLPDSIYMKHPELANPWRRGSRLVVARGWGQGGWRVAAKGYRISFGGEENALKLDSGDGCPIL